jgi:UDP-N-acetylmuramoylalanine--D-glutamate ligase
MNKRIVILGAGESGTGAALLAKAKGYDVFVSDQGTIGDAYKAELTNASIPIEEGKHTEVLILNADEVVKSPGIPNQAEMVKKIVEKNIPIVSEIEFGSRYCKGKIIGITGSNGKTTTTSLLYHIMREAGCNVGLGGNIGESFAKKVIDDPYQYWVLELSSFQLDHCFQLKPYISVITNITPDHLDRYEYQFQNYVNAKFRIAQAQDNNDYFIVFTDNEPIVSELKKRDIKPSLVEISLTKQPKQGAWFDGEKLHFKLKEDNWTISKEEISLKGKHNYLNAMVAVLACMEIGLEKEQILKGLASFNAVEHRMEFVERVKGINFINDSKATNVDSVFYALESMTNRVILILGGVDKGNDYSQIEELVKSKVPTLVCMGKDNHKLVEFFAGKVGQIIETDSIEAAVRESFEHAKLGDTVLLSPACASFDLFKNYEDRGKQFKEQVQKLAQKTRNQN